MVNAKHAILNRRAIRAFKDTPVSDEEFRSIIKMAQKAPSWIDSQPGRVVIATGDKLNRMRAVHQQLNADPGIHTNSDVPFVPISEWDSESQFNMTTRGATGPQIFGAEQWTQMKGSQSARLFNAPAVAYLTLPKDYTPWSLYDLGAFGEAIMVAAQSIGVDSIPAFEFIKYPDRLRETLNVSADREFIIGIGLGHADEDAPINRINAPRMDLDQVLKIIK
ncbi:nitroreductase [Lactobacillus sp. Sy-1]|uniref:nitroreductase n=1 Tax=Lactobacillus sp. Sy-1 TaxID=2109645 RepID=UPI001C5B2B68|nr:nitroreductase [Lactobacillus sp. Sy-1]MBW1606241.1 nitroreductase [Lactobacillus sp. Sy-1]